VSATAEAVRLINREKGVLVDVCEPAEFAAGHAAGARNVPLGQLEGSKDLPSNKTLPLVLLCPSGARAGRAAGLLRKAGYENVVARGRRQRRLARRQPADRKGLNTTWCRRTAERQQGLRGRDNRAVFEAGSPHERRPHVHHPGLPLLPARQGAAASSAAWSTSTRSASTWTRRSATT
jgi:rhodanese-related sulfurtransferase